MGCVVEWFTRCLSSATVALFVDILPHEVAVLCARHEQRILHKACLSVSAVDLTLTLKSDLRRSRCSFNAAWQWDHVLNIRVRAKGLVHAVVVCLSERVCDGNTCALSSRRNIFGSVLVCE